jgi:hypothetical protein
MYDPEALEEFRSMMVPPLEASSEEFPEEMVSGFFEGIFGDGKTIERIREMSDAEFFSSFLSNSLEMASEVGKVNFKNLDVIGSVPEGDSIRHILTRMYVEIGDMEFEKLEVLSVKKMGDGWGIILSGQVKGLAEHFVKMFDPDVGLEE